MSSATSEWATPKWLFDKLNLVFNFKLDVAASAEHHLCSDYYEAGGVGDALLRHNRWDKTFFCNPPYGNAVNPCKPGCTKEHKNRNGRHAVVYEAGCLDFVAKGIDQVREHKVTGVYLVPARTDTEWFSRLWHAASAVTFIKGRLAYGDDPKGDVAPFPSCLVELQPLIPNGPDVQLVSVKDLRGGTP